MHCMSSSGFHILYEVFNQFLALPRTQSRNTKPDFISSDLSLTQNLLQAHTGMFLPRFFLLNSEYTSFILIKHHVPAVKQRFSYQSELFYVLHFPENML